MCNERRHNNVLYGSRKKRLDRKERKKRKKKGRRGEGRRRRKKENLGRTRRKIKRKKQYSSVLQLMGYLSQECDCWPFSVCYTNRGIRYLMFAKPWVGVGRRWGGGGEGAAVVRGVGLRSKLT